MCTVHVYSYCTIKKHKRNSKHTKKQNKRAVGTLGTYALFRSRRFTKQIEIRLGIQALPEMFQKTVGPMRTLRGQMDPYGPHGPTSAVSLAFLMGPLTTSFPGDPALPWTTWTTTHATDALDVLALLH